MGEVKWVLSPTKTQTDAGSQNASVKLETKRRNDDVGRWESNAPRVNKDGGEHGQDGEGDGEHE